jgi:hypothetical protein
VKKDYIRFNRPNATGDELTYAAEAQRNYQLSGDGPFHIGFVAGSGAIINKVAGRSYSARRLGASIDDRLLLHRSNRLSSTAR